MCNGTVGRGLVLGSRIAGNARFQKTAKREQPHYTTKIHYMTQNCFPRQFHYVYVVDYITQINSPEIFSVCNDFGANRNVVILDYNNI